MACAFIVIFKMMTREEEGGGGYDFPNPIVPKLSKNVWTSYVCLKVNV